MSKAPMKLWRPSFHLLWIADAAEGDSWPSLCIPVRVRPKRLQQGEDEAGVRPSLPCNPDPPYTDTLSLSMRKVKEMLED